MSTSFGGSARDLAAAVHQHETVGVLACVREVVHRAEDSKASVSAKRCDQLEHLLLGADVERARRLVEEQQPRVLGDRAGENGTLPLAAAQRAEAAVDEMRRVEPCERRARRGDVAGPGLPE